VCCWFEGRERGERGAREGRGRTAHMGDGRRKAASPSPWATIIVIHHVHVLALALLAFCLALSSAICTTTATQHCNYNLGRYRCRGDPTVTVVVRVVPWCDLVLMPCVVGAGLRWKVESSQEIRDQAPGDPKAL
jgi:hypothetical protein